MFAVFVTINIKDGFVEEFQKASFGDSQGSVRDEPGCYRFDILKLSEDKLKSFNEDEIIIPLNEDCVTPSTQPGLFKAGSILNIKILKKLLSTFDINKNCEVLKISKL